MKTTYLSYLAEAVGVEPKSDELSAHPSTYIVAYTFYLPNVFQSDREYNGRAWVCDDSFAQAAETTLALLFPGEY